MLRHMLLVGFTITCGEWDCRAGTSQSTVLALHVSAQSNVVVPGLGSESQRSGVHGRLQRRASLSCHSNRTQHEHVVRTTTMAPSQSSASSSRAGVHVASALPGNTKGSPAVEAPV